MVHKTIIYSFITLILIINTIIIYLINQSGVILQNTDIMIKLISTISLLIFLNTLIIQSNITQRVLYKKNFLKLNLIILTILTSLSIYQRILDYNSNNLINFTIIQTSLYIILLTITILHLKDLRKLILKLFKKNIKPDRHTK